MLMMLDTPRRSAASRAWTVAARFGRASLEIADAVLMWPFRVSENRRLIDTLAAMGDHELKDIGLRRQDLRDVLALPPARDAGRFLSTRRRDRRLWH